MMITAADVNAAAATVNTICRELDDLGITAPFFPHRVTRGTLVDYSNVMFDIMEANCVLAYYEGKGTENELKAASHIQKIFDVCEHLIDGFGGRS